MLIDYLNYYGLIVIINHVCILIINIIINYNTMSHLGDITCCWPYEFPYPIVYAIQVLYVYIYIWTHTRAFAQTKSLGFLTVMAFCLWLHVKEINILKNDSILQPMNTVHLSEYLFFSKIYNFSITVLGVLSCIFSKFCVKYA